MGRNTYGEGEGDSNVAKAWEERGLRRAELFDKGQSKRIWAELYKVGFAKRSETGLGVGVGASRCLGAVGREPEALGLGRESDR